MYLGLSSPEVMGEARIVAEMARIGRSDNILTGYRIRKREDGSLEDQKIGRQSVSICASIRDG
jgi:hypothetical protein